MTRGIENFVPTTTTTLEGSLGDMGNVGQEWARGKRMGQGQRMAKGIYGKEAGETTPRGQGGVRNLGTQPAERIKLQIPLTNSETETVGKEAEEGESQREAPATLPTSPWGKAGCQQDREPSTSGPPPACPSWPFSTCQEPSTEPERERR